ncbi:hypothetical protein ACE38V_00110 [Cytobacillus sp. Hz8]|uniref:hypothetical protein n=1 Tax=Cytobacillus sp. Hz8 TaxID=3347168 RepID=UPI0035DF045B
MKKKFLIASLFTLCFFCLANSSQAAKETINPEGDANTGQHQHHHMQLIDPDTVEDLMEEGYTKKDIFIALHIAKKANKEIEDVLSFYKKNKKSWDVTAKHFGVNLEEFKRMRQMNCQFFVKNKEAIVQSLAKYTNKQPEQFQAYIKDDISLRFLVAGAAISKLSGKDLEEIVKLKKQGQSLHDIVDDLDIDHNQFHEEMKKILDGIAPTPQSSNQH